MKSFDAQRIDGYAVCKGIAGRFDSILALCSGETQVNSLHHGEVLSLHRLPSKNLNGNGKGCLSQRRRMPNWLRL
jgi:hypothetical protein